MGSHNESVTDFTTFNHAWMRSIRGFLLDITGVLYNSSGNGGIAITGSVDAVNRLYAESKVRFVSNESTSTRAKLAEKLHRLGFTLDLQHIFTPAPVAANYVKSRNLKPHLLVHKGIVSEFDDCINSEPKDCVVVGDAEEEFTYTNMNTAFRVLMNSTNPLLISLGCG
ncbi:haloacid dehalogenase-like hydrolase domain-containing protein [Ditylenchus destructor]|nr:haloacid dehalogenase-like hydrolase domain-containing protein [Ditylenchus destructor]